MKIGIGMVVWKITHINENTEDVIGFFRNRRAAEEYVHRYSSPNHILKAEKVLLSSLHGAERIHLKVEEAPYAMTEPDHVEAIMASIK